MRRFIHPYWLTCLVTLLAALSLSLPVQAAPQTIYADALAASWDDWSWEASIDFAAAAPVHGGSHSIAITYTGGWQGLYLAYPGGLSTIGFSTLRFYAHGGSSG